MQGDPEEEMVSTRERDRDVAVTTRRAAGRVDDGAALFAAPSWRHGRGVFAARRFRKGETLERCPVLTVSARECSVLETTVVGSYLYERGRGAAIALGLGSLLNHSFEPNAACELLEGEDVAVVRALRAIEPGEEVTILYCDEPDLWFDPRDNGEQPSTNGTGPASASRRQGKRRSARAKGNAKRNNRRRSG
jgi:SET domain-containing protein